MSTASRQWLVSRKGKKFHQFNPLLTQVLRSLKGQRAILDGEIVVLLDETGRSNFYDLMARRGEPCYYAFDLVWLITVRRSIDRVTGQANPPKTSKSAAPVPVIPTLKRLLDAHKAHVPLMQDGSPRPDSAIFPGIRQTYSDLDKMALRVIRPAMESANLKWYGWHAFRRGVASNLFQLGVDEMTVQRILRHSKVQVTRERYIKVRDEKIEQAMQAFEQAILILVQ